MSKFLKQNLILIIVIALSAFLRFFNIDKAPSRLTHDEMSLGYNAYSLIKTGQDEWGKFLPLSFRAFGDYKLPGYIYSSTPFIIAFGLSPLSVKIPSLLSGTLSVYLVYLITFRISNNKLSSLLAAVVMAINPWSIHLSRMALESNLGLSFFLSGLYFSFDLFKPKTKKRFIILSGLLFALSTYTYIAFRVTTLLCIFVIFVLKLREKTRIKTIALFVLSFVIFTSPLIPQLLSKSNSARFDQISIFSDKGIDAKVLEQRNFCFLQDPQVLRRPCQILYNKYGYLLQKVIANYLEFFLPTFLFIEGDSLEYLNDQDFGEFLLIFLPFYIIGIAQIWKINTNEKLLLTSVFFITPIASALAGPPQIVRGSGLLPIISIIIGMGLAASYDYLKKKKLSYIAMSSFLIILVFSFFQYYISYNYIYSAKYENYIYPLDKRAVDLINKKSNDFDVIYISSHFPDAHILLAFYNKIDPELYQSEIIRPKEDELGFSHPTKLLNYQFGDSTWSHLLCISGQKTLYVTFRNELPSEWPINSKNEVIKDFSGVHTQATFIDLASVENYLKEKNLYTKICKEK